MSDEKKSTEPVEAPAAASVDRIGQFILFLSFVVALAVTAVGTGTTIIEPKNPANGHRVSLWYIRYCNAPGSCWEVKGRDLTNCDELKRRFMAGESFAIISIGLALVGVIFSGLDYFGKAPLGVAAVVVGVLYIGTSLIVWGVIAEMYTTVRCEAPTGLGLIMATPPPAFMSDTGSVRFMPTHDLGDGFGLFVSGWASVLVGITTWVLRRVLGAHGGCIC